MRRVIRVGLAVGLLLTLYLAFWPVVVEPTAWEAPTATGLVGPFAPNTRLSAATLLPIAGQEGPEDGALGPDGRLYFTTRGGEILRTDALGESPKVFVATGGAPLGVDFDARGRLLVADAYRGLLAVDPTGAIEVLAAEADGVPIRYADAVAAAADGRIYFTDASTRFGAEANGGTYAASLLDILEHGGHGRLLEYDPSAGIARTVAKGLQFANGVALTADGTAALVCETGAYRVVRIALSGPDRGQIKPVLENLPGFPDNIRRGQGGRFWVGLVSPRRGIVDALSGWPRLRKMIQRLPGFMRPEATRYGHLIAIDAEGRVLASLQDPDRYGFVTGAVETDSHLFVTSLKMPALARLERGALGLP